MTNVRRIVKQNLVRPSLPVTQIPPILELVEIDRHQRMRDDLARAVALQARLRGISHLVGTMDEDVEPESDRPANEPLLAVPDLARLLAVDVRTVRRWRSEGRLPDALELGGVVRWDSEAVRAWIREWGQR